jgi:hypothetical protein
MFKDNVNYSAINKNLITVDKIVGIKKILLQTQ